LSPKRSDILKEMHEVFYPRSIAVVGASNNEKKMGYRNLKFPLQFGFRGKIYPVNPKEETVLGLRSYPTVSAIPDVVDRAVISVPAKLVPTILRDCAEKGVRVAQICTAGFAEVVGEGGRLQDEIVAIARASGMRLIGPNCMGTYCADSLMTYVYPCGASAEQGGVAFVSQSGGISANVLVRGTHSGIRFSKVISVGQCVDLNMADYLEYFMEDPQTETVTFYIEGLRGEGRRFYSLLKEAVRRKPVVILRGGTTEAGLRAVASHSGTMAGNELVWNALFKQTGAIQVGSIDELINTMAAFSSIKRVRGRGIAIIGNGGGASILASDLCSTLGLEIRPFSSKTTEKIDKLGLPPTLGVSNPFDTPAPIMEQDDGRLIERTLGVISEDPNVDAILFHINLVPMNAFSTVYTVIHNTVQVLTSVTQRTGIPVLLVFHQCGDQSLEAISAVEKEKARRGGLAVFPTLEDACRALSAVVRYVEFQRRDNGSGLLEPARRWVVDEVQLR